MLDQGFFRCYDFACGDKFLATELDHLLGDAIATPPKSAYRCLAAGRE
jgi:hypothetical protein